MEIRAALAGVESLQEVFLWEAGRQGGMERWRMGGGLLSGERLGERLCLGIAGPGRQGWQMFLRDAMAVRRSSIR